MIRRQAAGGSLHKAARIFGGAGARDRPHSTPAFCLLPPAYSFSGVSLNYRHGLRVKWPEEKLTQWKAAIIPASKPTSQN